MTQPRPSKEAAERAWFLEQVFGLCVRHHGRVISWGRDAAGNADVGGKLTSLHLWENGALAVDIKFQRLEDKRMVMESGARVVGLHWFDSNPGSTSLHVQARPAQAVRV